MVTRRRFLQGMAAFTALGQFGSLTALAEGVQEGLNAPSSSGGTAGEGVLRYVDVFVGTGGHGHTYPGATRPFGMVQLSPDTYNAQWDGSSGYHQGDGSIMGFSHTHLSGTGAADMLDVLVMPSMGPVLLQPGDRDFDGVNYVSRFDAKKESGDTKEKGWRSGVKGYRSHYTGEQAHPGYYRAKLTRFDILAELTATLRAGMHRYTFGKDGDAHLLVDLAHGYADAMDKPANVTASEMLRLNTAIAPTPGAAQNRLGVLGGDNAGFPNGRRPGDDVVDIELRVAMGVLCTVDGVNTAVGCKAADAPAGALRYTDGAFVSSAFFANEFPYLRAPLKGSPNDDNAIKSKARRASR